MPIFHNTGKKDNDGKPLLLASDGVLALSDKKLTLDGLIDVDNGVGATTAVFDWGCGPMVWPNLGTWWKQSNYNGNFNDKNSVGNWAYFCSNYWIPVSNGHTAWYNESHISSQYKGRRAPCTFDDIKIYAFRTVQRKTCGLYTLYGQHFVDDFGILPPAEEYLHSNISNDGHIATYSNTEYSLPAVGPPWNHDDEENISTGSNYRRVSAEPVIYLPEKYRGKAFKIFVHMAFAPIKLGDLPPQRWNVYSVASSTGSFGTVSDGSVDAKHTMTQLCQIELDPSNETSFTLAKTIPANANNVYIFPPAVYHRGKIPPFVVTKCVWNIVPQAS